MKKTIKWLFYLRNLVKMSTINKVRLVLTSIGIFAAVFLYSTGIIITNSYYAGKLQTINSMSNNTAIITSKLNLQKIKSDLSFAKDAKYISISTLAEKKAILSTMISDNQYLTVMSYVHGVSGINQIMPTITDDGQLISVDTKLKKGRFITQTDVNSREKVTLIDELTEELLFPSNDSIGKYIELGVGIGGATVASEESTSVVKLKVIGVLQNSYSTNITKLLLKQDVSQNENLIFANVSLYCPISTINDFYEDEDINNSYFFLFDNRTDYNNFVEKATVLSEIKNKIGENLSLTTKEALLSNIERNLSGTKTVLNLISLLLCLISGISIMSITLFSVKERIPEIGIRKAFGASKTDIVFQFVFEMVIIALIASLLAVSFSVIACFLLKNYIQESLYMPFSIEITSDLLVLPLLVGILEAVICSIIPSLYAANIKVTDSLRFE